MKFLQAKTWKLRKIFKTGLTEKLLCCSKRCQEDVVQKVLKNETKQMTQNIYKKVNYQVESLIKNKKTGSQDINLKRNINKTMELEYSRRYKFIFFPKFLFISANIPFSY